jgi:hypothetical protein
VSVLARSSSLPFRRWFGGIVFALVATTGAAACGGIGITTSENDPNAGVGAGTNDTVSGDDASTALPADGGPFLGAAADAGAEAADTKPYSSPLCGEVTACNPDVLTSNGCAVDEDAGAGSGGDGGGYGYGADGSVSSACRVATTTTTSSGAAAITSACVAGGPGIDGAACAGGDDCSAGYECVGAPGVCRRYCCSGACSDEKTFCDVQPTSGSSGTNAMSVPVCMPVSPCKLLASTCTSGNTCSVVADDGTTSCVAVGTASEGSACDTTHCMANEICVGKSGARVCEKLCRVTGDDCSGTKVCTGNATLFADPSIGVCTTPS